MPIKRLPGVYYDENVTYEANGEGSKIPIFIGKTGNNDTYSFVSYSDENKTNELGQGTVKKTGNVSGEYSEVEVLTNTTEESFIGQTFFVKTDSNPDGETPYLLYALNEETGELSSTGMYVTVIKTSKRSYDGTETIKFTAYKQINTTLDDGGLGQEDEDGEVPVENELMATIKEFYEESKLLTSDDVGVPHIYVIDVGDGTDYKSWTNALMKAKSLLDAQVEIPVGGYMKEFTLNTNVTAPTEPLTIREPVLCLRTKNIVPNTDDNGVVKSVTVGTGANAKTVTLDANKPVYVDENNIPLDYYVTIPQFMATIYSGQNSDGEYGLVDSARNLDLRYAFLTVKDATDEELKKITNEFNESRVGLCEPLLFGKTMSRICCTPNNTEPGYYAYRSVKEGTFIPRTKKEMKDLQDAGIIFNRDEHINGAVYPKINLCVATSFVDNPRPADALFHARFNADNLLREIFEASYEFVKANETASNIAYLQTKVNKLVNDKVIAEEMIRWDDSTELGTRLRVAQNKDDPYALEISGQLQPVKCTIAIDVTAILRI